MGCGTQIACETCKTTWYCGYGSYSRAEERKKRWNEPEHEGHEWFSFSEDWTSERDGKLWGVDGMYSESILIDDWSDYKYVDLTKPATAGDTSATTGDTTGGAE